MTEIKCAKCSGGEIIKSGKVRKQQRYFCKACRYHFTIHPPRGLAAPAKALAVLLYSMGKSSYGMIAKLFKVSRPGIYKIIRKAAENETLPAISEDIKDIEFDEMWHFIQSKKTNFGSGKPWIVLRGRPSPGLLAIVMLKPLKSATRRSNT